MGIFLLTILCIYFVNARPVFGRDIENVVHKSQVKELWN